MTIRTFLFTTEKSSAASRFHIYFWKSSNLITYIFVSTAMEYKQHDEVWKFAGGVAELILFYGARMEYYFLACTCQCGRCEPKRFCVVPKCFCVDETHVGKSTYNMSDLL